MAPTPLSFKTRGGGGGGLGGVAYKDRARPPPRDCRIAGVVDTRYPLVHCRIVGGKRQWPPSVCPPLVAAPVLCLPPFLYRGIRASQAMVPHSLAQALMSPHGLQVAAPPPVHYHMVHRRQCSLLLYTTTMLWAMHTSSSFCSLSHRCGSWALVSPSTNGHTAVGSGPLWLLPHHNG